MAALVSPDKFPPADVTVLDRGNGTTAIVHLHGATVLNWQCNEEEQFFLSSKNSFDNKKPIRGGIPLCFPHFGPWSQGPLHGFGRTKRWTNAKPPTKDGDGNVEADFTLEDDTETREIWNYKFKLVYTIKLTEKSLECKMAVHNTGTSSFEYACVLHTYFRVADVSNAKLAGLKGLTYVDMRRDDKEFKEEDDEVTISKETARLYQKAGPVTLQAGPGRALRIAATNSSDVVVWNPWEEVAAGIPDLEEGGWRHYVCVETGNAAKVTVEPAQALTAVHSFTLL